jgi:hypothetical protein
LITRRLFIHFIELRLEESLQFNKGLILYLF